MEMDWSKGLTERQKEHVAARGWAWAASLLPCLCGADERHPSTHTHMPGIATCPANLRVALAHTLCGVIVREVEADAEP